MIFSSWKVEAAPPTLEAKLLPSTEADLDAFIDHRVNVINGDYCEVVTDLAIKGPDDLILQRYYNNSNYITGEGAGAWRIFPQCWLTVGKAPKGKSCSISGVKYHWTYAFTGERSGSILTYSGWESNTAKDEGLRVWAFRDGRSISNTARGEMSGRVHVQNNLLQYQTDTEGYTLTLGDGSKRFFEKVEALPSQSLGEEINPSIAVQVHEPEFYRLMLEILPSGNRIYYSYDDNGHLARVEMFNALESKTLSWMAFDYQEQGNQLTLSTSDETLLTYTLNGSQITSDKYSDRPEIKYDYNNQGKLTRVTTPAKTSDIAYDTKMRVASLNESGSVGKWGPSIKFTYGNGYTEVANAIGQKTIYRYSKKQQLEAVEHYDRSNSK
jgi:YD repeat-containing protein